MRPTVEWLGAGRKHGLQPLALSLYLVTAPADIRSERIPQDDMAQDHIRYDILTQDALRGVVRKVLSESQRPCFPASITSSSRS